jgi:hypothetical protein
VAVLRDVVLRVLWRAPCAAASLALSPLVGAQHAMVTQLAPVCPTGMSGGCRVPTIGAQPFAFRINEP